MGVETQGTVQMRGESGPGVRVEVFMDESVFRVLSGDELIGEWDPETVGIASLNEGFAIRAEGEEFVLKTENDAAIAEAFGMAAASPRMARKVAASHPPEEREPPKEPEPPKSQVLPILFAVGGALVLAGGVVLRQAPSVSAAAEPVPIIGDAGRFWIAFVIGGLLMAAVAYILALGRRGGRIIAMLILLLVVLLFVAGARSAQLDADGLLAYGFIAGGIVVGVAVVFSGSLRQNEE